MSHQIVVRQKCSAGSYRIIPICPKARLFAELAGTKTLTIDSISRIMQLGFEVFEASEFDDSEVAEIERTPTESLLEEMGI